MTVTSRAQQRKVFTSTGHTFQFNYPDSFAAYRHNQIEESQSLYFIPVCENEAAVCVLYPKNKYEGTGFEGASFQVSEISASTESECLTPPANPDAGARGHTYRVAFVVSANRPTELINGTKFMHGEAAGAATGHVISTDLYRNFHLRRCFELSVRLAQSNLEHDPPGAGPEFTRGDQQHVLSDLNEILRSFKFVN
jgi:hypothetical protein